MGVPHHPAPGEFGAETWLNGSNAYTGNTGVWAQISADETLGLAYLPVELPTGDYYGGDRPGANLFAESIVAVDIKTGVRRWHFQLVHHGVWDMDIPCAPILADIVVNGRPIKALAQLSKQGFLYVFNRETGEPVWPIEERPVPKGDTPGEWYSPTQPFPTKPPAYERQGLSIDDLIDFTPELRAEAVQLVSRYRIGPIFTPPSVSRAEGPVAHPDAGRPRRRDQLAGRFVRSRDAHPVRVVAGTGERAWPDAAASRGDRLPLSPGDGHDRRAALGRVRLGRQRRRQQHHVVDGAGTAAHQATVWTDQCDRSE